MPVVPRLRRDDGFMMVELLMAITIMVIALTSLVAVFSSGIISMGGSTEQTTATLLADAQMGTFRTMLYMDVGLDLSDATVAGLDSTYIDDSACANSAASETCAANGVENTLTEPTGLVPDSCSQIDDWYSDTRPCDPSRVVDSTTAPASPDGRPYRIDTYVVLVPAVTTGSSQQDAYKEVTVVVRNGNKLSSVLARETSDFVCATGEDPADTSSC